MKKLLLHVCCAVCGAALIELLKDRYEIIVFYSNSNIYPKEEYMKRRDSAKKLAEIYKVSFIEDEYNNEQWLKDVKGFEKYPEGSLRCNICFEKRLERTAKEAKKQGVECFTTTLFFSPYKNEGVITQIGEKIGPSFLKVKDICENKEELWKRTRILAKEFDFYHQKYCGCCFSVRK